MSCSGYVHFIASGTIPEYVNLYSFRELNLESVKIFKIYLHICGSILKIPTRASEDEEDIWSSNPGSGNYTSIPSKFYTKNPDSSNPSDNLNKL